MFRRKMKNTAAVAIPQPQPMPEPAIIHNHGTPWPAIIVTAFVCGVVALPVAWWILTFLFEQIGYREPGPVVAQGLVWGILLLIILAVLKWFLTDFYAHRERVKELEVERSHHLMLASGMSGQPASEYGKNARKAAIIKAVMAQVYQDFRDTGELYAPGGERPWSKRKAHGFPIPNAPAVSKAEAEQVRGWLLEMQMISDHATNSQPNFRRYPDFAAAVAAVDARYRVVIAAGQGAMMETDGREFYKGFSRGV